MAFKHKHKRIITWTLISLIGLFALAVIVVPPMITLNFLKPKIQQTMFEQTGVSVEILGDINFSLLGHTTIIAHDIRIPIGSVDAVMFKLPLTSIFNLKNAKFTGNVSIYGGNVHLDSLAPQNFNHSIDIYNSVIKFQGKNYDIIRANLMRGNLVGTVRTAKHKYDIDISGDEFHITNKSNQLNIFGLLYNNGTARGNFSIVTDNINSFFEFETPKITNVVNLMTDFEWDGGTGFKFTNLRANNVSGNITLYPNKNKDIKLYSPALEYDLSFLVTTPQILNHTNLDIDFYGNLKLLNQQFKHIKIVTISTNNQIQIENIIADDIAIVGGTIDGNGAKNLMVTMSHNGVPAMCLFSGNPDKWECSKFTYGNLSGHISVSGDKFDIFVQSDRPMPKQNDLINLARDFGTHGIINFQFTDAGGTISVNSGNDVVSAYTFARGKTLEWFVPGFELLPKQMMNVVGDFTWDRGRMKFLPRGENWVLELGSDKFTITGNNIKNWFPNIDLRSINNSEYKISGTYHNETISDLRVSAFGHSFSGTVNNGHITLQTDVLDIDSLLSQDFTDKYYEMEFLTTSPIMLPFEFNNAVSLSANTVIYNGDQYKNFVYSLKPNIQTFSINDKSRGTMLASLERIGSKYKIFAQLNRFAWDGLLLPYPSPLNIQDSTITAEINMTTHGYIAHDQVYNLSGSIALSLDGGKLVGMGIDNFFASAENITTFNVEYALANALTSGTSSIKTMRIVGEYNNGDFKTTRPIELHLRHTDATGTLEINNGTMTANLNIILRGTSPVPAPIDLKILPNGGHSYSLSEIMNNFDASYMRNFVKTHNQF